MDCFNYDLATISVVTGDIITFQKKQLFCRLNEQRVLFQDILGKLSDKVCQCYIGDKSQLLVLGKSFSGVGKRLVLTSGDFERPFLLTNSEDVVCCLLEDHLIVASFATNCLRLWPRGQNGAVGDFKLVPISETGVQVKLLNDNLYILTKSGVVSVFNVVYYRSVKQVRRFYILYFTINMNVSFFRSIHLRIQEFRSLMYVRDFWLLAQVRNLY